MPNEKVFAVIGLFDSPGALLEAIPQVKTKATGRMEAYSPYPIHGIDEALGLRKSPITGMVLVMGIVGVVAALGLQLWTSGLDYPQMTAGKPYFSWEAFVPIMFEVMVLFACFTAGLGMLLLLNRLPFFRHPMLQSRAMAHITRDKFGLAVESTGEPLDEQEIAGAMNQAGAVSIETLPFPEPVRIPPPNFLMAVILSLVVSCAVAGYSTYWAIKLFPVTVPMAHMQDQPRINPQSSSSFFKDGFGMRMPVQGTIARGGIPYPADDEEAAAGDLNPLPVTEEILRQGRQCYRNYCSPCHGIRGNGVHTLTAAYGAKPTNLVSRAVLELSDGTIHHTVIVGKNSMPPYAADLSKDESWAVVHYVRALQRALNAKDEDIQ